MARSEIEWAAQYMIRISLAIKDIMELLPKEQYDYFFRRFSTLLSMTHSALQFTLGVEHKELRHESIRCARRMDRDMGSQGLISNIEQEWTEWFDILYNSTVPM